MKNKGIKKLISMLTVCAVCTGMMCGPSVFADAVSYDFNDTSWHTAEYGDESPKGFEGINNVAKINGTDTKTNDVGLFPYKIDENNGAVEIKSSTTRSGTGIGYVYPSARTSGYAVNEFDVCFPDFNVQRVFRTRKTASDSTGSTIATLETSGQFKVLGGANITLEKNKWYTVKTVCKAGTEKTGGQTFAEIYDNGKCIFQTKGTADNLGANFDGSIQRMTLVHNGAKVSSTYIDNWTADFTDDYIMYLNECDTDFSNGTNISSWKGHGTDNGTKTYTLDGGYLKIASANSGNYFNAEYYLTNSSYFTAAEGNSIAADMTVNFPDFNSEKQLMMRSGTQCGYASVSTAGALSFAKTDTGVVFETGKNYRLSFKYNIGKQYGFITVSDSDGNLMYDSSKDGGITEENIKTALGAIGNTSVVRTGIGIAKYPSGTSSVWIDDFAVYETDGNSFPTQAKPAAKDNLTVCDFENGEEMAANSKSDEDVFANVTEPGNENNHVWEMTLNNDDYLGAFKTITGNLRSENNFVIKASVKMNDKTPVSSVGIRNDGVTEIGVNFSVASFVRFDMTTGKIYSEDSILYDYDIPNEAKNSSRKKEIGKCEPNKWYDVTVVYDQANKNYNVLVESEGLPAAFGEGTLTDYDLPSYDLTKTCKVFIRNGIAGWNDKVTGGTVYVDNLAWGVVKTAPIPNFVSCVPADNLPMGAGVGFVFDNPADPSSFVGMTYGDGNTVSLDMISASSDGKTVYISGLDCETEYSFAEKTVKSFYGEDITVPARTAVSGTFKAYITEPVFTDKNGVQIWQKRFAADNTVKVTLKGKATAGNEVSGVKLLVGQYAEDGTLVSAAVKDVLTDTSGTPTSAEITLDERTQYINAFVWNTANGIMNAEFDVSSIF